MVWGSHPWGFFIWSLPGPPCDFTINVGSSPGLSFEREERGQGLLLTSKGYSGAWRRASGLRGGTKPDMGKVAARYGSPPLSGNQCEHARVTCPYVFWFWDLFLITSLHCPLILHSNSPSSFHTVRPMRPFPKDKKCEWIVSESKQDEFFLFL